MSTNVKNIVRTGLLLAMAMVFQLLGRSFSEFNQYIVGPLVNAILVITVFICNSLYGIAIGIMTPVLAFLVGILPSPLGPFVPFIIVGNILLVAVFGILKPYHLGKYAAALLGPLLKFIFLYGSATKLIYIINLNFPQKVLKALVTTMGINQLITALAGSVIALLIISILQKRKQLI